MLSAISNISLSTITVCNFNKKNFTADFFHAALKQNAF